METQTQQANLSVNPQAVPKTTAPQQESTPVKVSAPQQSDPIKDALAAMKKAAEVEAKQEAEILGDAPVETAPEKAPQAEAKPKEAAAEKPKETTDTPTEEPTSKAWEVASRLEKKNRELAAQLKEQQSAIEKQRAEVEAKLKEMSGPKIDNPVQWAIENLSQDEFIELANKVSGGAKVGTKKTGAKTEAKAEAPEYVSLREEVERLKAERQQEAQQRAVAEYQGTIKSTLDDPEFAVLRHWPDMDQEVLKYAANYAQQTGELLTPKDAASILKETLIESIKAVHLANPEILPELLGLKATVTPSATKARETKTLGNNLTSQTQSAEADNEDDSEEAALKRAAKMIAHLRASET